MGNNIYAKHIPDKIKTTTAPKTQEFNKHKYKRPATVGTLPMNGVTHLYKARY